MRPEGTPPLLKFAAAAFPLGSAPLLTALPGAQILELSGDGVRPVAWAQLELADHWRAT